MAFKEVSNNGSNIKSYWPKKAAERKEGDSVTGVYLEKLDRQNPDGSASVLYILDTENGKVGVNSSAMIARAFEQIPKGSTVKIVYNGKARSQKTGREYNDFKVYVDEDTTKAKEEEVDLDGIDF